MKSKSFSEKLKTFQQSISDLFKDQKLDFQAPTAEGAMINISDSDGDGKPMPGDMVTDADGNAIINAEIEMKDGTTINTDSNGAITKVDPKGTEDEPANPASAAVQNSVQDQLNSLKEEYETLKNEKIENELAAEKVVKSLTARLEKIYSQGYTPKDSTTAFRSSNDQDKKLSKEERKKALEEDAKALQEKQSKEYSFLKK